MQNAPLHEILQGAGILEQQAINSILPANGQLEDTVIVRMLLHYAEQAYLTVKVAVLHPELVARFYVTTADGAYEGMALLNDISDQNKASNYIYTAFNKDSTCYSFPFTRELKWIEASTGC